MQSGTIYHTYNSSAQRGAVTINLLPQETEKASGGLIYKLAKYLAIFGFLFIFISYAPSVWYLIQGGADQVSQILSRPVGKSFGTMMVEAGNKSEKAYQPVFNPSLPLENRLIIPSIGVDTQIQEATSETLEEVLRKGVWRVSDFSTPVGRSKPVILAAHRFGYLSWSVPFRLKNSFYNLPKVEAGETIEIVWRQRKYVYAVYAESEGEEITDYSADLILYTCQVLDSPVRIFKYARLLEI